MAAVRVAFVWWCALGGGRGTAHACSFEAGKWAFLLPEEPDVIDGNTANCDSRKECEGGIIRGCKYVVCSGDLSCYGTQILDVPKGGKVTCSGSVLACSDVMIEAAKEASPVSVECSGSCRDAIIRGAKKVDCTGNCGSAQILDVPGEGTVSCSGQLSCLFASIQSAEDASISVNCSGSSSCDEALVDLGAKGEIDCGSCGGASIRNGRSVLCESDFGCSGASMKNLSNGGKVVCSGSYGCFNADITPSEDASISVECSGYNGCSVAVIDSGAVGKVICSGEDSCKGNDLFFDYTIIRSRCLECSLGSCLFPCSFAGKDCADGVKNGDCSAGSGRSGKKSICGRVKGRKCRRAKNKLMKNRACKRNCRARNGKRCFKICNKRWIVPRWLKNNL